MINTSKAKKNTAYRQIAGMMPNDPGIEFAGVRKSKTVIWLQHGSSHYFCDLPKKFYNLLKTAYQKDHKAVRFLSSVTDIEYRQVELYTYYMYGELDGTPDIENGILASSENFRDIRNCPSLLWNSKNINIGPHILTPRQLIIIDLIGNDLPDKAIAAALGVSHTTLDFHKATLYKAVGVKTKTALLKLSLQHKIIN